MTNDYDADALFREFWERCYAGEERDDTELKGFVRQIWMALYHSALQPQLVLNRTMLEILNEH